MLFYTKGSLACMSNSVGRATDHKRWCACMCVLAPNKVSSALRLQVWFQNARAKYRRNLLKGQGKQSGDEGELKTGGSRHEASLSELSSATSPAMSDSSSTPSLPDMTSSSRDESIEQLSNSNLTELFSTSLNAVDDGYC